MIRRKILRVRTKRNRDRSSQNRRAIHDQQR